MKGEERERLERTVIWQGEGVRGGSTVIVLCLCGRTVDDDRSSSSLGSRPYK